MICTGLRDRGADDEGLTVAIYVDGTATPMHSWRVGKAKRDLEAREREKKRQPRDFTRYSKVIIVKKARASQGTAWRGGCPCDPDRRSVGRSVASACEACEACRGDVTLTFRHE